MLLLIQCHEDKTKELNLCHQVAEDFSLGFLECVFEMLYVRTVDTADSVGYNYVPHPQKKFPSYPTEMLCNHEIPLANQEFSMPEMSHFSSIFTT